MYVIQWMLISDPDVTKKITCLSDTSIMILWFRKMMPWKWRDFQEERGMAFTKHLICFAIGKRKYPLAERYTSVQGKHIRLYKRIYDY